MAYSTADGEHNVIFYPIWCQNRHDLEDGFENFPSQQQQQQHQQASLEQDNSAQFSENAKDHCLVANQIEINNGDYIFKPTPATTSTTSESDQNHDYSSENQEFLGDLTSLLAPAATATTVVQTAPDSTRRKLDALTSHKSDGISVSHDDCMNEDLIKELTSESQRCIKIPILQKNIVLILLLLTTGQVR